MSHATVTAPSRPSSPGTGPTFTGNPPLSQPAISARISNAYNVGFGIPSGVKMTQFDGTSWSDWAGTFEAIMTIYEAEDHLRFRTVPTGADPDEWNNMQQRLKAYLCLYMTAGVFSQISDEFTFPTVKDRWDELKRLYSGVTGSTSVFNDWITLTQAKLDESSPLGPQLTKLNEARVNLANAKMGVSDTQYCFILLHTLPDSYEVLVSTILASGDPSLLHPGDVVARIQNEEA